MDGSYFTYIMTSRSHTLYIFRNAVFEHKWKEHEALAACTTMNLPISVAHWIA
jgi:hypothetical protein